MSKLFAIVALFVGIVGVAPAQTLDTAAAHAAPASAPSQIDSQKQAWFDHAVEQMLDPDAGSTQQ